MSCPALTNKGGKLYISEEPVDCDLTLSELAVLDYVFVPGVGSIGDTGIEQDVVTYPTTDAGLTAQGKGDAVARNWDIEVLDAPSQSRDILDEASAIGNYDSYATRIEWPNGDVEFSIVQVASRTAVKGAASGVRVIRYTMVPSFVPIVTNALPVASNVVVSGTYFVGDTLTATYDYYSPLGLPESGSTYQWYADGAAIPGADALTYVIGEDYEGAMISFGVAPSDGDHEGIEASSSSGGPVSWSPANYFEKGLYGGGLWINKKLVNGAQNLYQDIAGVLPVENDGDTVGLRLDSSLGYDRGVVNLLSYNEDLSNAAWTKQRVVITGSHVADESTNNNHNFFQSVTVPSSAPAQIVCSWILEAAEHDWAQILTPSTVSSSMWFNVNLSTLEIGNKGSSPSFSYGAQPYGSEGRVLVWISFDRTSTTVSGNIALTNNTDAASRAPAYTGSGGGINCYAAQVEYGSVPSQIQKKTDTLAEGGNHFYQPDPSKRATYKTAGYREWLLPNGTSSFYQTVSAVDMKGSAESSIFVFMDKGASTGLGKDLLGLSANPSSTAGATSLALSASLNGAYRHRGTSDRAISAVIGTTPQRCVLSGRGSISQPRIEIRIDSGPSNSNVLTQGSGVLANSIAYSMARGGTSLFADGPVYAEMLIGRYLDDEQMERVEQYFQDLYTASVNLFLMAGQSNAEGRQPISGGPDWIKDGVVDGALVWNGAAFGPYDLSQTGPTGCGSNWAGVLTGAANCYSWPHVAIKQLAGRGLENIAVCQVSSGSSPIYPEVNDRGCWNADYESVPEGNVALLEALENRYEDVKTYCAANDITINLMGVLWHQGERDGDLGQGAGYQARFQAVIDKIREFTESPSLPIFYGTISHASSQFDLAVETAQFAIADNDPNAYCRNNAALTLRDGLHFNAPAIQTFGDWAEETIYAVIEEDL